MTLSKDLPESPATGLPENGFNDFGIRIADESLLSLGQGREPLPLYTEVIVDGEVVEPYQSVDLPAFVASVRCSGRFEIFVCGCSIPRSCGALFHGVHVRHASGGIVQWTLHRPQWVYNDDAPYDGSFGPEQDLAFTFSCGQMRVALGQYFDAVRALDAEYAGRLEWPIRGQTIAKILKLEARVLVDGRSR